MTYQPKSYRKFVATAATATLVATAFAPFASAHSFKDVETKYEEAVNFLVSKGVSGYPDGTFKTQKTITRLEAAEMLGKALGLDKVTDAPASGFTDVPARVATLINAFKAKGITSGKTATTFAPNAEITRGELAVWIQKAYDLKAKEGSTNKFTDVADNYKAAVQAFVDNKIASGTSETTFGTTTSAKRGDFALFVKRAADAAVVKEVVVESVSAINTKTLKVEFNTAVDTEKATFEFKRGAVKPSVKEVKFSEDKKSATIEFTTALAAGDYTVTVNGLTETALTGSVKVEAEKLTKINFLSDIAVISSNNVVTNVTAENQYGELITKQLNTSNDNITATTSKGTRVSIDNAGRLTVEGTSGLFKTDDKVVVTIVDSATGVTTTKTLTVAQSAAVASITVGEIKTDDKDLAAKPLNVANYDYSKFYLPVEVKDQYGNVLKAADLNGSVTVTSSNKQIINPANTVFVDTKDGVVVKFQNAPQSAQTHGTAVLTFVAAGTGKTASTSVTIKENYKLDTVTLETPASELKLTEATELPISITNSYGEEVALKDVTVGGTATALTLDSNTTINAIGATLSVEQDYVNKKAVLKITPTAKNITLTVVTATGKSQVLSLTANDAPVVSAIKGIDDEFVTILANDTSLSTQLDGKVKFVDQYGNDIAAPSFDGADNQNALDYTIKAKDASNDITTMDTAGTIVASQTAGTETYEVILKNAKGEILDTKDVTVTVVDAAKLTEFGVYDLDKFYTATTAASTHAQDIDIFGLWNGKKVVVNQDMAKDFTASNGLLGVDATTGVFTPEDVDTKEKDVQSTITVLVEAGDKTYQITKDVIYSNATPKATSLDFELNGKSVSDVVQITPKNTNNIFTGTDGFKVISKDQYGKEIKSGFKFVVTNNTTNATISVNASGAITVSGSPVAGKSFQLNVSVNGITKAIKVVIG